MTHLVQEFIIDSLAFNVSDRKTLAMVTLPKVIAYRLALPTSPVESPELFYISNHLSFVNSIVSGINESLVIDVDLFTSLVKAVWLTRYRILYMASTPEADLAMSYVLTQGKIVGEEYCQFITTNTSTINSLLYKYIESSNARSIQY